MARERSDRIRPNAGAAREGSPETDSDLQSPPSQPGATPNGAGDMPALSLPVRKRSRDAGMNQPLYRPSEAGASPSPMSGDGVLQEDLPPVPHGQAGLYRSPTANGGTCDVGEPVSARPVRKSRCSHLDRLECIVSVEEGLLSVPDARDKYGVQEQTINTWRRTKARVLKEARTALLRVRKTILSVENGSVSKAQAIKTHEISEGKYDFWMRFRPTLLEAGVPAAEDASDQPPSMRGTCLPRDRVYPNSTPAADVRPPFVRRVRFVGAGGLVGAGPSRPRPERPSTDLCESPDRPAEAGILVRPARSVTAPPGFQAGACLGQGNLPLAAASVEEGAPGSGPVCKRARIGPPQSSGTHARPGVYAAAQAPSHRALAPQRAGPTVPTGGGGVHGGLRLLPRCPREGH